MKGIRSKRVLIDDRLIDATIFIKAGKIQEIVEHEHLTTQIDIRDYGNMVIMPGLIDSHVHINEPGNEDWEGFDTATKAAAAGGITTLIDMPLNSIPVTTNLKALHSKLEKAHDKIHVNCGFYAGIVPQNSDDLDDLLAAGVFGIKAFLTHSGLDEFPNVTKADILKSSEAIRKSNLPLLAHCELSKEGEGQKLLTANPKSYAAYLASRPDEWEYRAVEMMIDLSRNENIAVHIVHVSSATVLPLIRAAKAEGLLLTAETCPQYLYYCAEDIQDSATAFKCAPPIRDKANNEELWKAVMDGTIDFVVSDHSPAPPELKEIASGRFDKAWGGISSLQFGLSILWTLGRNKNLAIPQLHQLMGRRISKFLGLENQKGRIAVGYDADIVVWNPDSSYIVAEDKIYHRHKITPYLHEELYGVVESTFVGGKLVYDKGKLITLNAGKTLFKDKT